MRHARTSRFAVLFAVGLLAALASATKPARSAEKASCSLKITGFAQVAFFSEGNVTHYQYAINFRSGEPANEASLEAELVGGGGHNVVSTDSNLVIGANRLIAWTEDDEGATRSHKEQLILTLGCPEGFFPPQKASTKLYKPGEAQPLVQPWVNGCPDWLVIDSRGSTEPLGTISPPGALFANQLRLQSYYSDRQFVIGGLANPYPAKGDLLKYILAKLPLPLAYRRSKAAGVKWLKRELELVHQHCRGTDVYLSGYSQGAQVTGDVYQAQRWPKVRGVVMFGDLKFNPSDVSDRGNFDRSLHGYLGKRREFGASRVWTFCHAHDPACQGWTQTWHRFKYHKDYDKRGEPQLAAKHFVVMS